MPSFSPWSEPGRRSAGRSLVTAPCLFVLLAGPGQAFQVAGSGQSSPRDPRNAAAVDRVVHDLCDKRVALLGESPTHGFGTTMALKVEIAVRLVEQCHYHAFFNESGVYDFLNIRKRLRAGEPVDEAMVAAAIGGLWATRAVEPLVAFLTRKVRQRRVVLGGLDDQLAAGSYAQLGMPADLVGYLGGQERARCLVVLRRCLLWQYTNAAPYGAQDRARILGCVDRIEPGARGPVAFNGRDRSMYENFRWLMARLPANSKVIVWTAVNHAAKELSKVPGHEAFVPLGSYIHRAFGSQAFALGFSADSGSYAMAGRPPRPLEQPVRRR